LRGNIMPGDGVYRSTDAGKTWTHVGFAESHGIAKIRIHPTNPQIVFVASFGKYSARSPERGIFKSTDGGQTWRKVLYRDDKTGGIDIAIDRNNPNVVYAALWEAYRKEYQMSSICRTRRCSGPPTAARQRNPSARRRTAISTTSGSIPTTRATSSWGTTAGAPSRPTPPAAGPTRIIPQSSSITRSPPRTSPTTYAALSRTTARCARRSTGTRPLL